MYEMTAAILAGGKSTRIGTNKAFLQIGDTTIIERQLELLGPLFREILVSTNSPDLYASFGLRCVADQVPIACSLAGVHAALVEASHQHVFVLACDMPFVDRALIQHLARYTDSNDIVIPRTGGGFEPLHCFYSQTCIDPIAEQLARGDRKILNFFPRVRVKAVEDEELGKIDPQGIAMTNINTQEEYRRVLLVVERGSPVPSKRESSP